MRGIWLGALLACSCAVRLDEPSVKAKKPMNPVPVASACRPFDSSATLRVSGRVSSVSLEDKRRLFIVGSVRGATGDVENAGFVAESGASPCSPDMALLDHPVLESGKKALAPVLLAGVPWLFFASYEPAPEEPFGVKHAGNGVARWDASAERFVPTALLWTADCPSYGSGAIADAGLVYVYGCQEGGFLSSDCFVARAPEDGVSDESAYEYYSGGGNFATSADDAWRIVTGGDPPSVAKVGDRWILAYVPPLGTALAVRSGLSPFGPWSKAVDAFGCELGADDSFCADAVLHALPSGLWASYAIGSFTPGAADGHPEAFWTRFVPLALPSTLP